MAKPIRKFRAGSITADVFENEGKTSQGKDFKFPNVSFARNYKDDKGEWKTTSSLRKQDLPNAVLVLEQAFAYLVQEYGKDEEE